jgi:predicted dehydrogenase
VNKVARVRFGFWGAGAIAQAVAGDFRFVPSAQILAIGSRTKSSAIALAARTGSKRTCTAIEQLLADPDIDVVYIATPNTCHYADMLRCIEAGKAVLCEKPFTLNAHEAKTVIDLARARGIFLMEGMWSRFVPSIVKARASIERGAVGTLRHLQASFAYPAAFSPSSRLFSLHAGGGALLDRGVYMVSLCQHLLGSPIAASGLADIGETGVDEQCSFDLQFANGALASCFASLRTLGSNDAVLAGDRGLIRLHAPFYKAHRSSSNSWLLPTADTPQGAGKSGFISRVASAVRSSQAGGFLQRVLQPSREIASVIKTASHPYPGNGYQFQIAEVVRCMQAGLTESSVMPHADTLAVMRTMDALRGQWKLVYPTEQS